jgi:hypothetical protein
VITSDTLHAELEGAAYLDSFARLLRGWREQGYSLRHARAVCRRYRSCAVADRTDRLGEVPGRSGTLSRSRGAGVVTLLQRHLFRGLFASWLSVTAVLVAILVFCSCRSR